ncbi:MAG: DUF2309 domain-containing protein [Pseudomonas sp.]|uniref:YbcC family protein n=1 Tax=Pseudomonas sp. TaxID=306 RepID=UPI0027210EEE|nr:DUF2309 domain-containing protein [Pseudomonas sp.]MDO9616477.1 DUF2309 domain-containing protein [Pseudomonas sp.]MDP2445627.1 DUF2309 domain-containing protein [Pseudomonas sp.]MDZ4338115.1 DUF2309 domain-containing protein [Pseudomonas sp.]
MTALEHIASINKVALHKIARQACERIAPTWPLDRMIAVNPLWERRDQPWAAVAEQLWRRAGTRLTLTAADYRTAWQTGQINQHHLDLALAETSHPWTPPQLLQLLDQPAVTAQGLPLLEDMAKAEMKVPGWPALITQQIGQSCAAWFDENQSDWRPAKQVSLYQAWRESMLQNRGLSVLSACRSLGERIAELPLEPHAALESAVQRLGLAEHELSEWFDCLLLRSLGWASWCAYQRWQARLEGGDDPVLQELLAIRAAWEWLVDDRQRDADSCWSAWRVAWQTAREQVPTSQWQALQLWQRAEELAWQEQLQGMLQQPVKPKAVATPIARVYFCIDVRSEVLRRALEEACPQVQTGGFAGFFGLPIAYTPLGTQATRPQLPGLLAAQLTVTDSSGDAARDRALASQRNLRLERAGRWQLFERLPASTFTLVEALGLGYAGALLGRVGGLLSRPSAPDRNAFRPSEWLQLKPTLPVITLEQRTSMAARILRAMSLTHDFPPLLVLLGHGSQSTNNPQAAGLDCGACCGQSGEVNARVLADVLNDTEVRKALINEGIDLPVDCRVLAGLHNTTTDEIQVFASESLPQRLQQSWRTLRQALDDAGERARRERAALLGLANVSEKPGKLLSILRRRGKDWAQTRPEWGLAGNAAFIAAPRLRTCGQNLQGRAFLHDYDWQQDTSGEVLELIMTAPMVVANWINLQYLTSTTDNLRFGSGNKVLHNVVGGRIGVFEGNGGDLRIGLAHQSLHDGKNWIHRPLRLTVVIEAPQSMIDKVIAEHAAVSDLVMHGWLYLLRIDSNCRDILERRTTEGWQPLPR